jgi:hypothetical protein
MIFTRNPILYLMDLILSSSFQLKAGKVADSREEHSELVHRLESKYHRA